MVVRSCPVYLLAALLVASLHLTTTRTTIDAFVPIPLTSICNQDPCRFSHHESSKKGTRYSSRTTNKMRVSTIHQMNDDDNTNVVDNVPIHFRIIIEYCTGCKWNLRAFWMVQELLQYYHHRDSVLLPSPGFKIDAITVIPSSNAGTFRITGELQQQLSSREDQVLWDRTIDIGFPEDIDILIDRINAWMTKSNEQQHDQDNPPVTIVPIPHLSIYYNRKMNYLFRSTYIAQEILSTFHNEINAISILPIANSNERKFQLVLDKSKDNEPSSKNVVWEYDKSFIPIKQMKQLIRDQINPMKDLGHSDVVVPTKSVEPIISDDSMDDDEAEQARNFFGVA